MVQLGAWGRVDADVGLGDQCGYLLVGHMACEGDAVLDSGSTTARLQLLQGGAFADDRQVCCLQRSRTQDLGQLEHAVLHVQRPDVDELRRRQRTRKSLWRIGELADARAVAHDRYILWGSRSARDRQLTLGLVGDDHLIGAADRRLLRQTQSPHQGRGAKLGVEQLRCGVVHVIDDLAARQPCEQAGDGQRVRRAVEVQDIRSTRKR